MRHWLTDSTSDTTLRAPHRPMWMRRRDQRSAQRGTPAAAITQRRAMTASGTSWRQSIARAADGGLVVQEWGPQGEWSLILDAEAACSLELPGTRLAWRTVEVADFTPMRLVISDDEQRVVAVLGWLLDYRSARAVTADTFECSGRLVLRPLDGSQVAAEAIPQPGSVKLQMRRVEFLTR